MPLIPPSNAQPLSRQEMTDLASGLRQGVKKAEAISFSLDAYDQAVEVEDAKNAALESRFTLDNVRTEWQAFASLLESNLVRLAMVGADLRIENKVLIVKVKTLLERTHIQSENSRLLDTLRQRLHDPKIQIRVDIDDSKVREEVANRSARPLSKQETLAKIQATNPLINELMQRFGLTLDE